MASTYSNLKIQLMATGENSGTWGNVTNVNLGTAIEQALVQTADIDFTSGDVTLSLSDSNAAQNARALRLNVTNLGAARNLVVPAIEKPYIVNNSGGSYAVTIKVSGQTGIAVPAGKTMWVYNNGTDVVDAVTHLTSLTLASALPIASGGTGTNSTTYCNLEANVLGVLPVANGGTAANTAAGARGSLGLDTDDDVQFDSFGVGTAASGTTGEIRATNNVTAYYSSDARLKENVSPIKSALDKVLAIGGKTFDWSDAYIESHGGEDGYFVRKNDFGVIAQDVQAVFPQAVREREDGTLAVDYEKLSALAFQAIVELKQIVDDLHGA